MALGSKALGLGVCLCLFISLLSTPVRAAESPAEKKTTVELSTWYWLNAAPKSEWKRDFEDIADIGFTHVILCWGYDASAFRLRTDDSLEALRYCEEAGIKAYLFMWHPRHNSLLLEARPEHLMVDSAGTRRFSFNLYNKEWRDTQWRTYLETIGKTYGPSPALAGYVFDDSFGIGRANNFAGDPHATLGSFIGYTEWDRQAFRQWVRTKYKTLEALNASWNLQKPIPDWVEVQPPISMAEENRWDDWVEARGEWLLAWARDTMKYLHEADPNPEHISYIEDMPHVMSMPKFAADGRRQVRPEDRMGLDFGAVTGLFHRMGAYTASSWGGANAQQEALGVARNTVRRTLAVANDPDRVVYTFWVSDMGQVYQHQPVTRPSAKEMWEITELAFSMGVKHVDYYAYRVGDALSVRTVEEWKSLLPGDGPAYPLAKPYSQTWLNDRAGSVRSELRTLIRDYFEQQEKAAR